MCSPQVQYTVLNEEVRQISLRYMGYGSKTFDICWVSHPENHDKLYPAGYLENPAVHVTHVNAFNLVG